MKENHLKRWDQTSYQEYLTRLKKEADLKYQAFHKRLTTTKYEILGVRVPIIRKITREMKKSDLNSFFAICGSHYYEEVLVEGLLIAQIEEENFFLEQFERYLPKIDNWAICDSFCNSLKIVSKNPEKYFTYFLNLLKEDEPFKIRVGLVTILNFYIKEEYLKEIFQSLDQILSDHYYVNMAMAWLLAEIYILYPSITEEYFKSTRINDFTMNKTISKIRDSYRVSKEKKEDLLKYKRRV